LTQTIFLRHSTHCQRLKLQILLILQLQQEFFSSGDVGMVVGSMVGGGMVSGGVVSVSMNSGGVVGDGKGGNGGNGGGGGMGSSNPTSESVMETSPSS
jgi:hypothetical protein